MKREEIVTALSARLYRQGVTASRADIEAFAASLPRTLASDEDIDALAARFGERQATALRRRRIRAWIRGLALALIGLNYLVGGSAAFVDGVSKAGSVSIWATFLGVGMSAVFVAAGVVLTFSGLVIAFNLAHGLPQRLRELFQSEPPTRNA